MSGKGKTAEEAVKAFAYLRTSSAANVGQDKDSEPRQRDAISAYAKRVGIVIVQEFRDPAVSGKDPIDQRPGFKSLLEAIAANGVRTVVVESADRFARHLLTQEAGIALLVQLGVRVLTSNGDDLTESDDEFRIAMRQVMGIFAQLERTRLVKKLKHAREAKRAKGLKVEGRKSVAETNPNAVAMARRLRRANPVTHRKMSLRDIAEALALAGFVNAKGQPFDHKTIAKMCGVRRVSKPAK